MEKPSNISKVIGGIIGVLLLVALVVFGYLKFKEVGRFDKTNTFYSVLENVGGLSKGVLVEHRGIEIGKITKIDFKTATQVIVTLKVEKGYKVPKNAVIAIRSGGAMAGNYLVIEYDQACEGNNCATDGDYFPYRIVGSLENLLGKDPLAQELGFTRDDGMNMIDSLQEKFLGENSQSPTALIKRDIVYLEKKLSALEQKFEQFSEKSQARYRKVQENLAVLNKSTSPDKVSAIRSNLNTISKKLDDVKKHSFNTQLEAARQSMADLSPKITTQQRAVTDVSRQATNTFENINRLSSQVQSENGSFKYLLSPSGFNKDLSIMQSHIDSLEYNIKYKKYYFVPFSCRKKVLKKHPNK